MNKQLAVLEAREQGQFPMSIGSSLAFEGAAGIYPDREESPPPPIDRVRYRQLWFNLSTVFRNLFESCEREARLVVQDQAMFTAMVAELAVIEATVSKISNGQIESVFYLPNYEKLHREFPRALLRVPATPKQLHMATLERATLKHARHYSFDQNVLLLDGLHIQGQHAESLIITHCAVDLLDRYRFKRLDLLESHTGLIKPHTQWNTKLTSGKDHPHLPFTKLTLQVLGDKGHHFNSMGVRLKNIILDIADRDKWTVLSTREKLRLSLRLVEDPADRAMLEALV